MALVIKDVTGGGGGFFAPKKEVEGAVYLIEVERYEHQRPSQFGPRDSAVVNMTVFNTPAELDAGNASEVRKGHRIEQTILAGDLEGLVGAATIVTLGKASSAKPGQSPAWVWKVADDTTKAKVIAYAEKAEAARQAAISAAPDFG